MTTFDISTLLVVIGVLVALVNIITEVIKKLTWDKLPTSLVAAIISEVLTLVAFFAYIQIKDITLGIMVAYAAMFGFDKLREIIEGLGRHE